MGKLEHWFKIVIAKIYACCENDKSLADNIASCISYANKEFYFKFEFEMDCKPVRLLVKDKEDNTLNKIKCDKISKATIKEIQETMKKYASR